MKALTITRRVFSALAIAMVAGLALPAAAQTTQFTDYGWPEGADEKISPKSIAWLKEKGWWPIQVAFQPPWSGQNTINLVMDKKGFLAKRGVEAKWQAFPSGPSKLPSGIMQSSKEIEQVSEPLIPSLFSILFTMNPGDAVGTRKAEIPFFPSF